MTPGKRFLLIFFAVYLVGAIAIIVLYGPPGYSQAYMDQYEEEHQRYLEITKSTHKMRAPSFKGLRDDKLPDECVLERPRGR